MDNNSGLGGSNKPQASTYPPFEIKVTCDFSKPTPVVDVSPDIAELHANQRLRFVCDNAALVIVAQHHSRGKKEADHSPFANDALTLTVQKNSSDPFHITAKGAEALPPGDPDPGIKHPGYKYTVVAISADGKIGVKDPTIIIRQSSQ